MIRDSSPDPDTGAQACVVCLLTWRVAGHVDPDTQGQGADIRPTDGSRVRRCSGMGDDTGSRQGDFIVARADAVPFLERKLALLGLTDKEAADFITLGSWIANE